MGLKDALSLLLLSAGLQCMPSQLNRTCSCEIHQKNATKMSSK